MRRGDDSKCERWHSDVVTTSCLCLALAAAGWGGAVSPVVTLICFAAVLLIGLPHGGLDHKVGRELMARLGWPRSYLLFGLCYLAVGGLVIASWFCTPALTVFLFFALSAWHFGLEEASNKHGRWAAALSMLARGGMVIWLPCWWHREAVSDLLSTTIPGDASVKLDWVLGLWAGLWPVWIVLVLFDCLAWDSGAPPEAGAQAGQMRQPGLRVYWRSLLRHMALAALMLSVHPLIAFTVYFCGWHSIRGLIDLGEESALSARELAVELLPVSLLAIGLFVAGWFWGSRFLGWTEASVQTMFLGLSAVAIPHLMLHVLMRLVPKQVADPGRLPWGATA